MLSTIVMMVGPHTTAPLTHRGQVSSAGERKALGHIHSTRIQQAPRIPTRRRNIILRILRDGRTGEEFSATYLAPFGMTRLNGDLKRKRKLKSSNLNELTWRNVMRMHRKAPHGKDPLLMEQKVFPRLQSPTPPHKARLSQPRLLP